jgi:uncharacterized protein
MSFALQMQREAARSARFPALFLRRQLGLLVIGVVHAIMLSAEDILVFYALMGFALLLFRRAAAATILTWALVLYLVSFIPAEVAVVRALGQQPSAPVADSTVDASRAITTYRSGTLGAITAQRVRDYLARNPATVPAEYPRKFAFFLLGLLIVRLGVLGDIHSHRPLFARAAVAGLSLGLLGRVALFLCYLSTAPPWTRALRLPLAAVANPALSLGYGAIVILAFQDPRFHRFLRPLGAVGRTALTNYVLQSVICTSIFYAYGFALYGTLGPLYLLALSVVIFALQIGLSAWWMGRFRLGPLEWLWRSFTYRAPQPMRVATAGLRTNYPP